MRKKTIIIGIKLLIGVLSFWLIYNRLHQIPNFKNECVALFANPTMYFVLAVVLLLMPVNWGIESYKWKLITAKIEPIPYKTAIKSVFSGICLGNLAPGRAMEFVAKIYFFKSENKPTITLLHFINGMFQMLITVTFGVVAIAYKANANVEHNTMVYGILIFGVFLIFGFCLAIFNVNFVRKKLSFIKWFKADSSSNTLSFSSTLIIKLISFSIIRYAVFTTQFYLIYSSFTPNVLILQTFAGISAYFMLTSIIPMISVIEPAIRAAIALFVFNSSYDNSVTIVLTSTFLWIINVIIPSGIGYIIILKEKINPKKLSLQRNNDN